jgi:hypothetical protein
MLNHQTHFAEITMDTQKEEIIAIVLAFYFALVLASFFCFFISFFACL